MAKSKNRKDHKKKSLARNNKIQSDKNRVQKAQREWIMNMIKHEQEKGLFENTPNLDSTIDPLIEGPII
jgi:hypothetical protein